MNFLTSLWNGITGVFSILLPFGQSSWVKKIGPGVRWFLHLLFLFLVLVGLYYLTAYLRDKEIVVARDPRLQPISLPLIFLILYAMAWIGWWIYKLLVTEADPTDFPDIDDAWEEALDALDAAGINITEVPLFIILGRPEAPEENLFNASQINFLVKNVPSRASAPLHVYGNRDAVFITCAGCSLLGKQAALLALEGIATDSMDTGPVVSGLDEADKTLKPTANQQAMIRKVARSLGQEASGLDRRSVRREMGLRMPDLLSNTMEVERLTARLIHLCRLIVRDRQPYCPINGLLILAPLGATDSELEAQQSAELCFRDLRTIRRVLKVQCPMFALWCDLETLPGFRDFIHRQSPSSRSRRIGQRFPLASPDLRGETYISRLDSSIDWLCNHMVRDLTYNLFRVESGGTGDFEQNKDLMLFLDEIRERGRHLSRFLSQSLARDSDDAPLFGGCYIAGTGSDRDADQAFVRGVFGRLIENQSYVSWTDQALEEDERCHRMVTIGYSALVVVVVSVLALVGWQFLSPGNRTTAK